MGAESHYCRLTAKNITEKIKKIFEEPDSKLLYNCTTDGDWRKETTFGFFYTHLGMLEGFIIRARANFNLCLPWGVGVEGGSLLNRFHVNVVDGRQRSQRNRLPKK